MLEHSEYDANNIPSVQFGAGYEIRSIKSVISYWENLFVLMDVPTKRHAKMILQIFTLY